jgi:hypothetical protein
MDRWWRVEGLEEVGGFGKEGGGWKEAGGRLVTVWREDGGRARGGNRWW